MSKLPAKLGHVQGKSPASLVREVKHGSYDGTVKELSQEEQSPDFETSGAEPTMMQDDVEGARPSYEGALPWPEAKPLEGAGKPFKNLK